MALPNSSSRVHLSTLCLTTIGMFDLVTTLMWLNLGFGEGNPLFGPIAERGSLSLAFAKLGFLIGPVLLLEIARRYRPVTAEIGTWVAVGAYLYLYVGHLLGMR